MNLANLFLIITQKIKKIAGIDCSKNKDRIFYRLYQFIKAISEKI